MKKVDEITPKQKAEYIVAAIDVLTLPFSGNYKGSALRNIGTLLNMEKEEKNKFVDQSLFMEIEENLIEWKQYMKRILLDKQEYWILSHLNWSI